MDLSFEEVNCVVPVLREVTPALPATGSDEMFEIEVYGGCWQRTTNHHQSLFADLLHSV